MPYHYNHTGALRPFYQYGYPDYPDGAFRTSAEHLVTWLGAFMNFGKIRGKQVLSRSTVREIRRNQIPERRGLAPRPDLVRRSPNGYFPMGPHRRRLRDHDADVLPAGPAGRCGVPHQRLPRLVTAGTRSTTSSIA